VVPAPALGEESERVPVEQAKAPVERQSRVGKTAPAAAPAAPKSTPAARSAPVAKKASSIEPMVAAIVARSKTIVDAAQSVVSSVSRDRRTMGIAAGVVAVVAAAVVGVMLFSRPAPTGNVVIDAAPWGTITAIETESGDLVTLPSSTSTPFVMALPAGTYQVVVAGPPPESQPQRITVQVEANGSTVVPTVRFRPLTPEEYFEEYLSAPTAESGADPLEPAPGAPSQPAVSPTPAPATQSSPASTPAPVSTP
jgi:hypothetical protein